MNADDATKLACDGTDAEWFRFSGHCGHCGSDGSDCECTPTDPCGCGDLHPMGSRFAPKPIESLPLFPETPETA